MLLFFILYVHDHVSICRTNISKLEILKKGKIATARGKTFTATVNPNSAGLDGATRWLRSGCYLLKTLRWTALRTFSRSSNSFRSFGNLWRSAPCGAKASSARFLFSEFTPFLLLSALSRTFSCSHDALHMASSWTKLVCT